MSKLSIKVNIAGRTYPLNVDMSEEEGIRKAAKLINQTYSNLESNYSVRDKQDLLAMTCLQVASSKVNDLGAEVVDERILESLDNLISKIDLSLT